MPKDIILCVADEPTLRQVCADASESAGFRAIVASNGAAGLEMFTLLKDEICVVLSDFVMPAMTGIEMAERILQIDSQAKILLMSGYGEGVIPGREAFEVIRKPFIHAVLIQRIRSLTETKDSAASAT